MSRRIDLMDVDVLSRRGMTCPQIAEELGVHPDSVNRVVRNTHVAGVNVPGVDVRALRARLGRAAIEHLIASREAGRVASS